MAMVRKSRRTRAKTITIKDSSVYATRRISHGTVCWFISKRLTSRRQCVPNVTSSSSLRKKPELIWKPRAKYTKPELRFLLISCDFFFQGWQTMNVFSNNLRLIPAITFCNSAFKLRREYFLDESFITCEIAIKTTGVFENTLQFDLDAVKIDYWDEDVPMEIKDKEAVKPKGWLDNELEEIDDSAASKPEDWGDEEDGAWGEPRNGNPKCETAPGCGGRKLPMKNIPAYKGKWHASLIKNSNYKGIWKPLDIPNLNHFELDKPDFEWVSAIGIEIGMMQDGVLLDDKKPLDSLIHAKTIRDANDKKLLDSDERGKILDSDAVNPVAAASVSDGVAGFQDLVENGEKQHNLTIGILVPAVVVILTIFYRIIFCGKKAALIQPKVTNVKQCWHCSNK